MIYHNKEWKSNYKILRHIDKHIIGYNGDHDKWRDFIIKNSENNYTDLINEYKMKTDNEKIHTDLFNLYYDASIFAIDHYSKVYFYKSDYIYSLNFEADKYYDGYEHLTTCTNFDKLLDRDTNLKINSCFFKSKIIIDSSILIAAYFLYQNKIDSLQNDYIVKLKGISYLNDICLRNALNEVFIDDCRICYTKSYKYKLRYFRLIFYYFLEKYENLKVEKQDVEYNNVYKAIIKNINDLFDFETLVDNFGEDIDFDFLKNQLKIVNGYINGYKKGELPEWLITEKALLLFAINDDKQIHDFLNDSEFNNDIMKSIKILLGK